MNLPKGLMWERRPEVIEWAVCSASKRALREDTDMMWGCEGLDDDYHFKVLGIPSNLKTRRGGNTIRWLGSSETASLIRGHIIDAGACMGRTLKSIAKSGGFEKATAISLRKPRNSVRSVRYLRDDMQYSKVYAELEPADLVVSQMAIKHMFDKLAVLEMLSNCLNPGGHMLAQFDEKYNHTLEKDPIFGLESLKKLVEASGSLRMLGYHRSGELHVVRQNNEPVLFPVEYGENLSNPYLPR